MITARMPDPTQNIEPRPESPSSIKNDDVAATSPSKPNPGDKQATKAPPDHIPVFVVEITRDKEGNPLPFLGPTISRPIKTVECNTMSYTDGDGVARQIYMPKGTARLAGALLMAERFSDLARFPAWDDQTYDDWEADEEKYAYLNDELGEPAS